MNFAFSKTVRFITVSAVIAAVYAALTYMAAAMNLAYWGVQFRFSEALCILAAFTPAAIPGLTLGCLIGNLGSPFGWIDILCGTAASLIAAVIARLLRHIRIKDLPFLIPLPAVLVNAVIVGWEITFFTPDVSASWTLFSVSALQVGAGQLAMCYGLGIPLYWALRRVKFEKYL